MYCIQYYFICHPQIPLCRRIEPRTVATSALAVRSSNNSARSHPHSARYHLHSARSHPHSARFHSQSARSQAQSDRSHPHSARSYPYSARSHSQSARSHAQSDRSHPHSARSYPYSARSHSQSARSHALSDRSHPHSAISHHLTSLFTIVPRKPIPFSLFSHSQITPTHYNPPKKPTQFIPPFTIIPILSHDNHSQQFSIYICSSLSQQTFPSCFPAHLPLSPYPPLTIFPLLII